MTDRVSDEQLNVLISFAAEDVAEAPGPVHHTRFLALTELRERREAERKAKEEKPEPYDAWWTNLTCPKCGHEAVCLDKFGYRCLMSGCGWTKDEPVKS